MARFQPIPRELLVEGIDAFPHFSHRFDKRTGKMKNKVKQAREASSLVKKELKMNIKELEKQVKSGDSLQGKVEVGATALDNLNLDPIDRLNHQLTQVEDLITAELLDPETTRVGYLNNLITLQFKITEALLPYKYLKPTSEQDIEILSRPPIQIHLSFDDNERLGKTESGKEQ